MTTRDSFKVFTAEQVKNSIVNYSIYLTYGRSIPWSNEASPDVANNSVAASYENWRYMIGGKKITGNDIRTVIPRNNWTANTVYVAYDDLNYALANTQFYVVTTDWNVYKCLSNNSSALSTVMPTAISPGISTQTSDGYVWKYMYTLSSEELLRFTTDTYMPVKTVIASDGSQQWAVQQAATIGDIQAINITNGGSGYTNAANILVLITGDGASATAMANINNISNTVNTIVITNPGELYTNVTVTISGGGGSGATARAVISPSGGHGSDALYELFGSNLIINTKIDGSEGGAIPTTNDFRQIALLKDPILYSTSNTANVTTFNETMRISVTGVSSSAFQVDEYVYQGASLGSSFFSAVVNQWDSANNILSVIDPKGTPTTQSILGFSTGASAYVTSVTNPDLQKNSGRFLYNNNIQAITRSEDQADDFKILLRLS